MKKELSIEELHQIVLNIGKEFHKICINNNIPYYILAGYLANIFQKQLIFYEQSFPQNILLQQ